MIYIINKMNMVKDNFGTMPEKKQVDIFTLKNSTGMQVKITNYGARVTSILAPDRNGKFEDVVLGYDKLCDYLEDGSLYDGTWNTVLFGKLFR